MSLQIQLSWFGVNNLSFRNKMYHDTDTAVLVLSKLEPAGSVAVHHSILFSGLSNGCTAVNLLGQHSTPLEEGAENRISLWTGRWYSC